MVLYIHKIIQYWSLQPDPDLNLNPNIILLTIMVAVTVLYTNGIPSMSVTIDSSLLTGTYPDQHKIPGLNWYDEQEKRIVNYGTGFREMQ
jgi:hypothetical protein